MHCFRENPDSWGDKINYVDENNRFVGFDMEHQCCEDFGHGVFDNDGNQLENVDLAPYSFVDEDPRGAADEDGGTLSFRICAEGMPDLYVQIWNHHNGYYCHGFSHWCGTGDL